MHPSPATILAFLLALVPALLCSQGAFIAVKANELARAPRDLRPVCDRSAAPGQTLAETEPPPGAPCDDTPEDEPVEDRGLPAFVGLLCQDGQSRVVRSAAFDEVCFRASLEPAGAAWTHVRGLAAQRVDVLTLASRVRACSLAVVAPPVQAHAPPQAASQALPS